MPTHHALNTPVFTPRRFGFKKACISVWRASFSAALLVTFLTLCARAQTIFVDFNSPGQFLSNFNPWNDVAGSDGGNYSFQESTNAGVGGTGGVSVFQNADTTASYKNVSWDFS